MRPGPNPRPTKLKVMAGTNRKDRTNLREPQPVPGRPECPPWLSPKSRAHWDELIPSLEAMGVLSRSDGDALACYCDAFTRYVAESTRLRGMDPSHPAYGALHRQCASTLTAVRQLAELFGLTPASRSRVSASAPPELDDDEDAIFFGGRRS